ncbi:uncharacterized protein LOC141588317 [Silene latifolia]|uniref:uncharacterized protein LOC141588317 n=1 Tax=Silene latifolia TaxID=37657 RepID=UPI003D76BDFB
MVTQVRSDLLQRVQMSWQDPECDQVIQSLINNTTTSKYKWNDGQFIRKGRVVVGPDLALRQELLTLMHLSSFGGHSGVHGSYKRLNSLFYWKHMKKDVRNFIRKCTTVAKVFFEQVFKLHGNPETTISDRDKIFLSKFWQELFKLQHVELLHMHTMRRLMGRQRFTLYEVVYGQSPHLHVAYVSGDSLVAVLDMSLKAREECITTLKFHLTRAQSRMKSQSDKRRTNRVFDIDDLVYVNLQPYRQYSVVYRSCNKLAPSLRNIMRIPQIIVTLPVLDDNGLIRAELVAVWERKMMKKGNHVVVYLLIQWSNGSHEDATWEPYDDIEKRFPEFQIA